MDRNESRSAGYRVFLTRNSEYHLSDRACVGVRDRRTGEWYATHVALGCTLVGSITFEGSGPVVQQLGEPKVGECIFFAADGKPFRSSPVLAIEAGASFVFASFTAFAICASASRIHGAIRVGKSNAARGAECVCDATQMTWSISVFGPMYPRTFRVFSAVNEPRSNVTIAIRVSPSSNTNAPSFVIGARGAELILKAASG